MTVRVLATSSWLPAPARSCHPLGWWNEIEGYEHLGTLEVLEAGGRPLSTIEAADQPGASTPDCSVVVSRDRSAASMAVAAALGLFEARREVPALGAILYCHSSPDEALASSPACRLQHELKQPAAFPFALGQQGSVGVFTALTVAQAFLEAEPSSRFALIVAADRWLPPLRRSIDGLTVMSDAAGALLLGPPEGRGLDLVDVQVRDLRTAVSASPAELVAAMTDQSIALITDTLRTNRWEASDLRAIVLQGLNAELAARIREHIPAPADVVLIEGGIEHGFLSAADAIAALDRLVSRGFLASSDRVLVWGGSPTGHIACALLQQADSRPLDGVSR